MSELAAIIAPVFLIISLGYSLGRIGFFTPSHAEILIKFVWYVAVPFYLFRLLAPHHLPTQEELKIVFAYYIALFGLYGVSLVIAKYIFKQAPEERPVFAFVTCFGNGAFLGIPLVAEAFGQNGVRALLIILSFHTLMIFPISTILIETALGKKSGEHPKISSLVLRTLKKVIRNPILLSLFIGTSWSALDIPFPYWLERVVSLPANAASPVGLFAVGLSVAGVKVRGDMVQASAMAVLKLVALPFFVFIVSHYIFALPSLWVGVATLTASLPSGMAGYTFAVHYSVAPRRAASAVLISTVAATVTLTLVLLLLGVHKT